MGRSDTDRAAQTTQELGAELGLLVITARTEGMAGLAQEVQAIDPDRLPALLAVAVHLLAERDTTPAKTIEVARLDPGMLPTLKLDGQR